VLGADIHTRGLESDVDTMRAVIALRRCVLIGMHVDRIVRASLCARFASDTASIIEIDDPILAREQRFDRTDLDARSIGAMIASHHRKQSSRVGERAFLDVLHPCAVHADRHFMLGLAGDGTRVTADALSVVDDEAEVHRLERF